MSAIHDVVRALAQRAGVDAVVVLGPDGTPIDSTINGPIDAADIAAMVPRTVGAGRDMGEAAGRGGFTTGVTEYDDGFVVVSQLSPDVILAISVRHGVNIGPLLHDLHCDRSEMAALF